MLGRRQVSRLGAVSHRRSAESGQVLILWVLVVTVILVIGAIVVDVGLWLTERRKAQMAADFAAMAAASELTNPGGGDPVGRGMEFAQRNGFDDADPDVVVTVDPGYGPSQVEVKIEQGSPMLFTGIFGVGAFDIGARAVGKLGSGEAGPLDAVFILDRSGSMSSQDLDKAKDATKTALEVFDPSIQSIALGTIAAAVPNDPCAAPADPSDPTAEWVPVPLSNDYKGSNGALDNGSRLVSTITCLDRSVGSYGTNLGDPVKRAREVVQAGHAGAVKAIILLTDGQATKPDSNPCQWAFQQAADAKAAGIEVFTIGFGIEGVNCTDYGALVTELLADMATDSQDDNNNCSTPTDMDAENTDGDHFFCEAKNEDLAPVFLQIAEDLTQGYRLYE